MKCSGIKISIIIPVYNIAEYLPRCLDSVLVQTHKNLEIIVVDDGSIDSSKDVINAYSEKDSRIVAIFKENSGVSDTRNKGLEIATGDYIGFVDGDDYIEPDMYEILLKNALKYNADISHCGYKLITPITEYYFYNTGRIVEQNKKEGVIDLIRGDFVEPGIWNKLYKSSVINDIRMPLNIKNNEDYLFNVMVFFNAEKSIYEDKTPYHYILRKNSATTSEISQNKIFDTLKVRNKVYEMFKDDTDIFPFALKNILKTNLGVYRTLVTNKSAKKYSSYKKEIKNNVNKLYKEAKALGVLNKRLKVDSILILYFPIGYKLLYKVYNTLFRKRNKYEVK